MRLGCHTITWGGGVGAAQGVTGVKDLYYGGNDRSVAEVAGLKNERK